MPRLLRENVSPHVTRSVRVISAPRRSVRWYGTWVAPTWQNVSKCPHRVGVAGVSGAFLGMDGNGQHALHAHDSGHQTDHHTFGFAAPPPSRSRGPFFFFASMVRVSFLSLSLLLTHRLIHQQGPAWPSPHGRMRGTQGHQHSMAPHSIRKL